MENAIKLEFKKTRALNWLVSVILIIGTVLMALKASSAFGLLVICLAMFLFIAPFVITAIALSSDDFYFLGISCVISASQRGLLRKLAFYWNWVVLIFSLLGVALSVATQQPMASVPLFVYVVPTILNLIAFRKLKNSSQI